MSGPGSTACSSFAAAEDAVADRMSGSYSWGTVTGQTNQSGDSKISFHGPRMLRLDLHELSVQITAR